MKTLVSQFTNQLSDALKIGHSAVLNQSKKEIKNIVITGLGGSGIGGKIATQLRSKQLRVPVVINNDYTLPQFVSENSLIIVSSFFRKYGGNIRSFNNCSSKKCRNCLHYIWRKISRYC